EQGVILSGVSAGIICWFEAGLTDSFHGKYVPLKSLGFLAGSVCPHCDSDEGRFEKYIEYIQREEIPSGYAIDDGVALHFENGQLIKAVKSKPNAKVLFISNESGVIHQKQVETQSLIK
ncbi:MAG: Type 1 glutamine amidotransferase-like domain-containing protein, partial [Anaerorhabdus sp.]